jgi:DNA-binding transcriptional LysR family regulator
MDAKDLKVFQAVARTGGMNSAADILNTVQSNVTARIRALEQELAVKLFDRHSRGVTLTRGGERLLPYAKKIEVLIQEAKRAAGDDGTPRGPLTIGSLETTAAQRLSPIITAFGTQFRDVDLVLKTATNAALVEQVAASELDGAFVCAPVKHPDIVGELAFREELVIAAPPEVRSLKQLLHGAQLKIVVKGLGCAYRGRLEELLARRGLTPTGIMEFGTLEAIIGCVQAGLGVTLLPRGLLESRERQGQLSILTLPTSEARIEIIFIRRRDAVSFSAMKAFLQFAIQPNVFAEAAE